MIHEPSSVFAAGVAVVGRGVLTAADVLGSTGTTTGAATLALVDGLVGRLVSDDSLAASFFVFAGPIALPIAATMMSTPIAPTGMKIPFRWYQGRG
jgi:hypothetical protein